MGVQTVATLVLFYLITQKHFVNSFSRPAVIAYQLQRLFAWLQ